MVNINLDWRESVPHPDDRVEYELWTNSNDECGVKCDTQLEFAKNFKGAAQILEKSGYTQFTHYYITWCCPQAFTVSKQRKAHALIMEDTVHLIQNRISVGSMMVKMLYLKI